MQELPRAVRGRLLHPARANAKFEARRPTDSARAGRRIGRWFGDSPVLPPPRSFVGHVESLAHRAILPVERCAGWRP